MGLTMYLDHAFAPTPQPLAAAGENCRNCAVRCAAFCSALEEGELAELSRIGRHVKVKAGHTVLWEAEEAFVVGNVISGLLKLSVHSRDGREQIVGIVYPSDFIGRPFGSNSQHSVTAVTDAELCIFPRGVFDRFAGEHPRLEHALLRRTLDDLDRARHWMLLLARKTATERVASLLVEMAERLDGTNGQRIMLPLSRQQMADLLGMAIETVSRTLTAMKRARIIDLPGGRALVIREMEKLLRLTAE